MKYKLKLLIYALLLFVGVLPQLTSCRGKSAAKAVEIIEKATSKNGNKTEKVIKGVGKHADDAYRVGEKLLSSDACSACYGTGFTENYHDCTLCDGTGYLHSGTECIICKGVGITRKCSTCYGSGKKK